jgi:hypothetical protein
MSKHDDYEILLTLDTDDETCTNDQFKQRLSFYDKVTPIWGDSEGSKVIAINRDINLVSEFDILVCFSDDFVIVKEGADLEILSHYENGFSGLLHVPDGVANSRLCTLPIMDKAYYDIFKYIYNPIYKSVFCDNHQHELAILLGRYKYVPVDLVRHYHPAYGHAPNDDLYRRNEHPALYTKDNETYRIQKENQFFYKDFLS